MPTLRISDFGIYEIQGERRLVKAIEDCGVDIGHRCGGKAKCTTCRVRFIEGEPEVMTQAEYNKLSERELLGEIRLSCQILLNRNMHVEPLMRVTEQGWPDPGPEPSDEVEPEAVWAPKREFGLET